MKSYSDCCYTDSFEGITSSKPFVSSIEQVVFKRKGFDLRATKGDPIWALNITSIVDAAACDPSDLDCAQSKCVRACVCREDKHDPIHPSGLAWLDDLVIGSRGASLPFNVHRQPVSQACLGIRYEAPSGVAGWQATAFGLDRSEASEICTWRLSVRLSVSARTSIG